MNYELIEDVLDIETYEELNNKFNGSFFPWFYNDSTIPGADNNFMFTHHIYRNGQVTSDLYNNILPLLMFCASKTEKINLLRVKANLYTKTNTIEHHADHTDLPFEHKTALFYINNNNGLTVLEDGTKVESVENRLLLFDGSRKHHSTSSTNDVRININFNYF